jgi:hypothetical protein
MPATGGGKAAARPAGLPGEPAPGAAKAATPERTGKRLSVLQK